MCFPHRECAILYISVHIEMFVPECCWPLHGMVKGRMAGIYSYMIAHSNHITRSFRSIPKPPKAVCEIKQDDPLPTPPSPITPHQPSAPPPSTKPDTDPVLSRPPSRTTMHNLLATFPQSYSHKAVHTRRHVLHRRTPPYYRTRRTSYFCKHLLRLARTPDGAASAPK